MLDLLPLSKSERLSMGSLSGVAVHKASCKEDTSSAGSSSASERTLISERGKLQKQKVKLHVVYFELKETCIC